MAGLQFSEVALGKLGSIVTGRTPPSGVTTYFGDELPFITPSDMVGQKVIRTTERALSSSGKALLARCVVPARSVAVSCIGWQMGKVGMTSSDAVTNQQLNTIIPNEQVDPDYLYYALSIRQAELKRLGSVGTRTPIVNKSVFSQVRIPLPGLPAQRSIARILSAYDDLIDNCERRIRVLDEMARALFREWFVLFRYPGHEKTPLVDSPLGLIPNGWDALALDGLVELDTGKRPKGGSVGADGGVPSVGAENVNGVGRHDFSAEKFVPRAFFQAMRRGVVRDRDVALYKDGAHIGRSTYFRGGFPHAEFAVNEHVFLLRPRGGRLGANRLYLWLQQPETVTTLRSRNANAAQPGLNRETVGSLGITVPPEPLACQFEELVDPYFALIVEFAKRARNLGKARDLLLPRLLSGQLSVESAA
jgi:type I restriction enzyme S subunit